MNKMYRVVWSEGLGCWTVVSENAKARGKRAKRAEMVALCAVGLVAGST
ncbi:ESPR domain-containing protein [Candidatus Burkholderia verschuerenii]